MNPETPEKKPVSQEILEIMEQLTIRAENVREDAVKKLLPICKEPGPSDDKEEEEEEKSDARREYPPLFTIMRNQLMTIEKSLSLIDDVLDRAEV